MSEWKNQTDTAFGAALHAREMGHTLNGDPISHTVIGGGITAYTYPPNEEKTARKFIPIPDMMAAEFAEVHDMVSNQYHAKGARLVKKLDRFLDCDRFFILSMPDAEINCVLLNVGMVFGDALRREYNGVLLINENSQTLTGDDIALDLRGFQLFPLNRPAKFLHHGTEDSLHAMFKAVKDIRPETMIGDSGGS
jgi:hypothetical protein